MDIERRRYCSRERAGLSWKVDRTRAHTSGNLFTVHPSSLSMSSFLQDLRHAARQLWRRPVFTLTAVLTLAIGIGVNAVAFTVVNGVLFRTVAGASRR